MERGGCVPLYGTRRTLQYVTEAIKNDRPENW